MKRDEFIKKRWIGFEQILCTLRNGQIIDCMLLCVDFENETMKLVAFQDSDYEPLPFWAHISYLKRPAPKLKIKR